MLTSDDWTQLERHGGIVDLSHSVKLRLSGPDALRYLNGQVTNDVRRLGEGVDSMPACLCNHKGKLEAFVMISRDAAGAFYITADEALREFLPLRMEKYLIADDAVLEDVTEQFFLVHFFGPRFPAPAAPPSATAPHWFSAARLGTPGLDLWLAATDSQSLFDAVAAGVTRLTSPELQSLLTSAATASGFTRPEALETLRIDRGIPAWTPELSGGILPPEARLDSSAIDYYKGCYTGQEVISRIRSVGKVNRLLVALAAGGGSKLEAGWELFARGEGGAPASAGSITSAAWHPALQTGIALGFVKRSAADGELLAAPPGAAPAITVAIRKTLDD